VHLEVFPVERAELEDGDGLVHPSEEGVHLAEDLHRDARVMAVRPQDVTGAHEVLIRVVPGPHLFDGQIQDGRVESGAAGHGGGEVTAGPEARQVDRRTG
jgi:hypothetical protein